MMLSNNNKNNNKIIRLGKVGLTESAVGDVTDPVVVLTGKVPGLQWVVTPDHGVVAATSKPRVGWKYDVRAAHRYKM